MICKSPGTRPLPVAKLKFGDPGVDCTCRISTDGRGLKSFNPRTLPTTPLKAAGIVGSDRLVKCVSPSEETEWIDVPKALCASAAVPLKPTNERDLLVPFTVKPCAVSQVVTFAMSAAETPNWSAYCSGVSHW